MANNTPKDGVLVERLGPLYWPLFITLLVITATLTLYSGAAMALHNGEEHSHSMAADGHE